FHVRQQDSVFLPDLVGLERPFRLALLFQRPQIPGPQMLGAGQHAAGHDAGFRERLLHVRADRRDSAKTLTVVHYYERNAVDIELFDSVLWDLIGLAYALPSHCIQVIASKLLLVVPGDAAAVAVCRVQIGQCDPLSSRRFSIRTSRLTNFALSFSILNASRYFPTRNSRLSPASICELMPSNRF